MSTLKAVTHALGEAAARVAMLILVLMLGHILLEIALRLFGSSTFVLDEMIGYGVAAMSYLALASAFRESALIRVSLLVARLEPGSRAYRVVETACVLGTMFFISLAIWFFWRTVASNYVRGFSSGTLADVPMWIPQGLLLFGLLLFWLQLFIHLLDLLFGRGVTPRQGEQAEHGNPAMPEQR